MTKPIKRFIAGAVCPRCAEMDKIVIYADDQGKWRECVQCGYRNNMVEQAVAELPTRVSIKQSGVSAAAEPITFYPLRRS